MIHENMDKKCVHAELLRDIYKISIRSVNTVYVQPTRVRFSKWRCYDYSKFTGSGLFLRRKRKPFVKVFSCMHCSNQLKGAGIYTKTSTA